MKYLPFAHTFSIVAWDGEQRQMGVAVQSHWFSVGSVVAWAEPGVGVVATQSMVDVSYGPLGLALLRAGRAPRQALDGLLLADEGRALRQVAMLDATGRCAVHTGERCVAEAGHYEGGGFSVQANMMANHRVWGAMAEAYRAASGELSERLLRALDAAQAAGGDARGQQSACMLIVSTEAHMRPWDGRIIDLRVEDHPDPIGELRRLVRVQRAYQYMNVGDEKLGQGAVEDALQAYQMAAGLAPDIVELPFWQAVTLADLGRLEEALPVFQAVFAREPRWRTMLQRLPAAGLLGAGAAEQVLARLPEAG